MTVKVIIEEKTLYLMILKSFIWQFDGFLLT